MLLIESQLEHQNKFCTVRSLRNKITLITRSHLCFVFLLETWLLAHFSYSVLTLDDYVIYRKDRVTKGGGILIATLKNIDHSLINIPSTCEMLGIDANLGKSRSHRFILVYNPSAGDIDYVQTLCKELTKFVIKSESYSIIGDFNLPNINWERLEMSNQKPYKLFGKLIGEISPISQLIRFPTRENAILDLIITRETENSK